MFRPGPLRSCLIASSWLCLTTHVFACQVPVFRYALERWWPDPYRLVVAHQGALPPHLATLLAPYIDSPDLANLEIEVVDLSASDSPTLKHLPAPGADPSVPTLLLYYPNASPDEPPVFSAPFTENSLNLIIDSPARRQIASRILLGDSAVWAVLDAGGAEASKEAARLKAALDDLASYLELPDGVITPGQADEIMAKADSGEAPPPGFDPENVLHSGVPLRVGFSVVRIDSSSPEEAAFVRMLLAANPDLDPTSAPVAIPIFGRGRMLQGLPVTSLIDDDILPDACYYICGACSCQVKAQNPGLDLLLQVDWESALEGHTTIVEKDLPPLSGPGDIAGADKATGATQPPPQSTSMPISTSITATADAPAPPLHPTVTSSAPHPYFWPSVAAGFSVLAIALGSLLIVRRRPK